MLNIIPILAQQNCIQQLHSNKEVNDKDPKFKVGDHVRISK